MFCLGLFNSNDVSMETVENLKQKNFGGGAGDHKRSKSHFGGKKAGVSPDTRTMATKQSPNKKKI